MTPRPRAELPALIRDAREYGDKPADTSGSVPIVDQTSGRWWANPYYYDDVWYELETGRLFDGGWVDYWQAEKGA